MIRFNEIKKIEVKPNVKVICKSEFIGLKVLLSDNENELSLETDYNFPSMQEEDEVKAENLYNFNYDEESNIVEINFSINFGNPGKKPRNMNSKNVLYIPDNSILETDFHHGGISLDGLSLKAKLNSEHGSQKICNCSGDFELHTVNGSIKIVEAHGKFDLSSKNGSVKVDGLKGELIVNGCNGSVRVLRSSANKSQITNKNGSLYYEFTAIPEGNFEFSNKNGSIKLVLDESLEYDLKAENILGSLKVGFENNGVITQDGDKKQLTMVKNSGKVKINATNKNGSIKIMSDPLEFEDNGSNTFDFDFNFDAGSIIEKGVKAASKAIDAISKKMSDEKTHETLENVKVKIEKLAESENRAEIVEQISKVGRELGETFSNLGSEIAKNLKFEMKKQKAENFEEVKPEEPVKDDVSDSRMKILKMLEDGKISVDDAEKLLKAIDKE
jgi:hypothetical protein